MYKNFTSCKTCSKKVGNLKIHIKKPTRSLKFLCFMLDEYRACTADTKAMNNRLAHESLAHDTFLLVDLAKCQTKLLLTFFSNVERSDYSCPSVL